MSAGTRTSIAAGVMVVLALAWEAYALATGEAGAWTWSQLVWQATHSTPLVPLLFGTLMGHFFFPKGACVHCGLRPWAGAGDGQFDDRLLRYHAAMKRAGNLPERLAHEAAKGEAQFAKPSTKPSMVRGFATARRRITWEKDETPPRASGL